MEIHYSARFSGLKNSYHGNFEVNGTQQQVENQTDRVTSLAVAKLREKCEKIWGIDFNTLIKFEVYFYSRKQPKEILIFKKEKQQS